MCSAVSTPVHRWSQCFHLTNASRCNGGERSEGRAPCSMYKGPRGRSGELEPSCPAELSARSSAQWRLQLLLTLISELRSVRCMFPALHSSLAKSSLLILKDCTHSASLSGRWVRARTYHRCWPCGGSHRRSSRASAAATMPEALYRHGLVSLSKGDSAAAELVWTIKGLLQPD